MRRLILALMLIMMAGLGTAYAAGSDVTVVSGLDFGFKTLDLDIGGADDRLESTFVTINPNIGLAYESFYATASFDTSIHATPDVSTRGVPGGGSSGVVLEFSRTETTFTLGYRLTPSFSVFGGYTIGDNEFMESSSGGGVLTVREITYTEAGPFVGVAYNRPFGDKGTLAMSVGYAELDSKLKFVDHPGGVDQGTEGDNTGLSYGLTWSGPLTGSLGYRVGAKGTRYEMEGRMGVVERYTNFFIGISNYF